MQKKKKHVIWPYIILLVSLVYFGIVFIQQQKEIHFLQQQSEVLERKIEKEEKLKTHLLEEKENVQSNEYIESIAREKLGMVKDGERVFIDINR